MLLALAIDLLAAILAGITRFIGRLTTDRTGLLTGARLTGARLGATLLSERLTGLLRIAGLIGLLAAMAGLLTALLATGLRTETLLTAGLDTGLLIAVLLTADRTGILLAAMLVLRAADLLPHPPHGRLVAVLARIALLATGRLTALLTGRRTVALETGRLILFLKFMSFSPHLNLFR
jgi:hypothetical protein